MSHPHYSSNEIAERGQALFEREIRPSLDASAQGKFLVLDVETGDYEIDSDELAALKRARDRRPEAPLYLLRIGSPTAYRLAGLLAELERESGPIEPALLEEVRRAWPARAEKVAKGRSA